MKSAKLLNALRFLVASLVRDRVAAFVNPINDLLNDYIKGNIISKIRSAIRSKKVSPKEKEQYRKQLKRWVSYINGSPGQAWNKISVNAVLREMSKFPLVSTTVDDEIQAVAQMILKHIDQNKLMTRVDPLKHGPDDFRKQFVRAIHIWVINSLTYQYKKSPGGVSQYDTDEDEGSEEPIVEKLPAPQQLTEFDIEKVRGMFNDLASYVKRKAKDEFTVDIFDQWIKAVNKKDPSKVQFERDIYKPLGILLKRKRKTVPGSHIVRHKWELLRKVIVDFFEEELDYALPKKVKDKIIPKHMRGSVRIANILAHEQFRRIIAEWILGSEYVGMFRNNLK